MNNAQKNLAKITYDLFKKEPFLALLLQEINIRVANIVPTLGICFEPKVNKFVIYLNSEFFDTLIPTEQQAVLVHEILHFLHRHLLTVRSIPNADKPMLNIAMDMAINQYIQGLPDKCVDVTKFKQKDGGDFPKHKPFEIYYNLLQETKDTTNKEELEKFLGNDGQSLDQHMFDELTDEQKEEILKETKKVLVRTLEKSAYGHSVIPDYVKDLLITIDANIEKLNYVKLLKQYIKRSIPLVDRMGTWNRPSRKYGTFAKGTTVGKLPRVAVFIDTSGSFSHTEINESLQSLDQLLKIGQKKCFLGKWHTELYEMKPYKMGTKLKETDIQSGGTNVVPVLEYINSHNDNLSLIYTDGFYDGNNVNYKGDIVWIISKEGTTDHPFKHIGKTIKMA